MDNTAEDFGIPETNTYIHDEADVETVRLEHWKSNFNFTGDNPEYPVEMFVAIMEQRYNLSNRRNLHTSKRKRYKSCLRALNHIIDNENTPASLWKKQFLELPPTSSGS